MTRCQTVAVLNMVFFAVLIAVVVLAHLDMPDGMLDGALLMVLVGLAVLTGAAVMVVIAITSRKKGTVDDERDRLYGNRSFIAAYFALALCILAGPFAAILAFRGESIPPGFVFQWVGGSWAVSILVQSVATLVQYRRGS